MNPAWLLLLPLLSAAPAPLAARSTRLWVSGTSNLHDWTCDAQTVKTRIEVEDVDSGLLPSAVEVTVPVLALRCGEAKMDEKLQAALGAERHPEIVFVLERARAVEGAKRVLVEGRLTIAGVTRRLAFLADATGSARGLTVSGRVPVEMTDYGVEPPTALLGVLKTGNQVVVHFELELDLASAARADGGVVLRAPASP